jgi:hypothetical protein
VYVPEPIQEPRLQAVSEELCRLRGYPSRAGTQLAPSEEGHTAS